MDEDKIEVNVNGKWISVTALRDPDWPTGVPFISESPRGHLQVLTNPRNLLFRPMHWRILED